jgi:Rieske 2Fe-2S family protein
MNGHRHPLSPVMDHCPPTLPARAYHDAAWFRQEERTIWARNWVAAGRLNDLAPGRMKKLRVGGASVILCRAPDGALSAFHNLCRHRGAELCAGDEAPVGKLIRCPYHAWSYAVEDGRLVAVGHARPTADFRKEDHGLLPVRTEVWNGFVFVNLAEDPGPLQPDLGRDILQNWPMAGLITGHRMVKDMACNWKVFWENYNECLHCPGIHPELCEMVPLYATGVMAANEAPGWTPADPARPNLREGAVSWTPDGQACGPEFADLTAAERQGGYTFVTLYPTMFIVAHVDHVRAVTLEPTGPESTRLTAEWYFPQATLDQPEFDVAGVAAFAGIVMAQDAAACELNQRGLRSPAWRQGTLMPEEYAIHDFHKWVLEEMGGAP